MVLKKFKQYFFCLFDRNKRFLTLAKMHGFYPSMSDEEYLKNLFIAIMGYNINMENPKSFNEKLQWLKLNDRNPMYFNLVDKCEVKKYVAELIGDEHVIPTYGVWDKFEDIPFDDLPNQFVLKCTHDSGSLVVVKDKIHFDKKEAKKRIEKHKKNNYYLWGREWPYKNVKPRIIAEKYMEDSATSELRDYKFFCFNGTAKCFKVDFDRFTDHHANYFTPDGKLMMLGEAAYPPDPNKEIKLPESIPLMKELAEKLSKDIPFLRCDFYDVNGQVYFGELTFYPASGFGKFIYEGNDELLGSWLKLPETVGGGTS